MDLHFAENERKISNWPQFSRDRPRFPRSRPIFSNQNQFSRSRPEYAEVGHGLSKSTTLFTMPIEISKFETLFRLAPIFQTGKFFSKSSTVFA